MSDLINKLIDVPSNVEFTNEDLTLMMQFLQDNQPTNMYSNQSTIQNSANPNQFGFQNQQTPSTSSQTFNVNPIANPYGFQTPTTPMTPSAFPTSAPLFYQQTSTNTFQETNSSAPSTPLPPLSPQKVGQYKDSDIPSNNQANAQQQENSAQLFAKLQSFHMAQQDQLQKILQFQKQVLAGPTTETFVQLNNQHEQLKKQLDSELQALVDLQKTVILAPHEVRKAFYLQQQLQAQNMQLELYHQELQQLRFAQHGMAPRCFVALVIIEQPLPLVLTRGKALEEPVVVKLLTGANVNLQSVSKVKVNLIMDNPQVKGANIKTIESETESLDELNKSAKFHLKFLNGTRMLLANVKFSIQIQIPGAMPVTLESNASNPFVVITNECQYEEADGLLMRSDVFGPQGEQSVPWPLFANKLQRHFLRGARQDAMKPQRFLARNEISYLNQKFFGGRQSISAKVFDEFWAWFGKALQRIRYQRHLCSMFQSGLVYGFITREQVNASLLNQEVGTFLIRFSERHPGTFAIGYVINETDPEQRVRHYLIKPEDVHQKKPLPDFLMECAQFSKFLQVSYDLNTGNAKHRIIDKELVLEPYGVNKRGPTPEAPVNGYDPSLIGDSGQSNGSMDEEYFL